MGIIAKFTKANIKSAKTNVLVLVFSVSICSIVFLLSLAIPYYMSTYTTMNMRAVYGNSDISLFVDNVNIQRFATLRSLSQDVKDKCEYIYGLFAYSANFTFGESSKSYNIIGVDYDELLDFNPPSLTKEVSSLNDYEILISHSLAKKYNLSIGSSALININAYNYSIKVVGISKADRGMFYDSDNIIVSTSFMKKIAGGIYSNGMFNIAVAKVKPGENVDQVLTELANTYPSFWVSETVDTETINSYISFIRMPFLVFAAIVIVFCAFIILLCCNVIFTDRLKQFATLKSMGATNGQLVISLLVENGIYGLIGSIICAIFVVILIFIMQAIGFFYIVQLPFLYYIYMSLFGIGFCVLFSLVPAIMNSRKSIRQTMIISGKSEKKNIVYFILGTVGLVMAGVAFLIAGVNNGISSLFIMIGVALGLVCLVPFVIWGVAKLISSIFKKRAIFSIIYTKNGILSSSISMVARLMTAGFIVFVLLNSLPVTLTKAANEVIDGLLSDVIVSSLPADKEGTLEYIRNIEGVEDACFGEFTGGLDTISGEYFSEVYMFNGEFITKKFKKYCTPESLQKMQSTTKGYVLLGMHHKVYNNYKIGDYIAIDLDGHNITLEVAGFIDSMMNFGKTFVINLDFLNYKTSDSFGNNIFLNTVDYGENYENVMATLIAPSSPTANCNLDENGMSNVRVVNICLDLLVLVYFYAYLVMGLCFIAIIIGIVLSLRNNLQQHKIMALLGMNKKMFLSAFFFMILVICLCASLFSWLSSFMLYATIPEIITMLGSYVSVRFDPASKYIAIAVAFVLGIIISMIVANRRSKDFQPRMIQDEG